MPAARETRVAACPRVSVLCPPRLYRWGLNVPGTCRATAGSNGSRSSSRRGQKDRARRTESDGPGRRVPNGPGQRDWVGRTYRTSRQQQLEVWSAKSVSERPSAGTHARELAARRERRSRFGRPAGVRLGNSGLMLDLSRDVIWGLSWAYSVCSGHHRELIHSGSVQLQLPVTDLFYFTMSARAELTARRLRRALSVRTSARSSGAAGRM